MGSITRDYPLASMLALAGKSSSDLEQAVSQLYGVMHKPVCGYVSSILRDPSAAEDVAQEAFLRLYRHVHEGHTVSDVRSWLFRVAHNLAHDRLRSSADIALDADIEESFTAPGANAEQQVLEGERRERIDAALNTLSPRERSCLELRAEGLVYREIGEILGIRTSSVVTFLARAIRKISEAARV